MLYKGKVTPTGGVSFASTSKTIHASVRVGMLNTDCLVYYENMGAISFGADGSFSLDIGQAGASLNVNSPTLDKAMDPSFTTYNGAGGFCTSGQALATTTRYMYLAVDPLGANVIFGPVPLTASARAMSAKRAEKLGDHSTSSLLRVESAGVPAAATALTPAYFTELMALILGTSTQYEKSGKFLGSTLAAPSATETGKAVRWSGSAWEYFTPAGGVGTVTGTAGVISADTTGGAVTLNLPGVGTAGTYGSATSVPVFTTDSKGRITAVVNTAITGVAPGGVASGDLTGTYPDPTIRNDVITTAKIVDGTITGSDISGAITFTTTGGIAAATLSASSSISSSGSISAVGSVSGATGSFTGNITGDNIRAAGGLSSDTSISAVGNVYSTNAVFTGNMGSNSVSTRTLGLANAGNNTVSIVANPAAFTNYTFTLPTTVGTNTQVLSSDGGGNLVWANASVGGLSAVTNTANLANAKIWIGDSGGKAQEQTVGGDLSATDNGTFTIASSAVTTGKINDDAVTTSKILAGNVTSAKIADANITTVKIADANVTTAKVADDAISFAKLQNIISGKLLGRSSGGSGDAEELSVGTGLTLSGSTLSAMAPIVSSNSQLNSGMIWVGSGTNFAEPVTLAGDVTVDNSGNTLVGSDKITFSKMQNISTARILGRSAPGSGDPEELTIGGGLTLSAGILSASGLPSFPITAPDGLAAAPTYSFSNTTNAGMYSSPSSDVSFATSGANRVTIASDGNVGIGTNNPMGHLHIQSTVTSNSGTYNGELNSTYFLPTGIASTTTIGSETNVYHVSAFSSPASSIFGSKIGVFNSFGNIGNLVGASISTDNSSTGTVSNAYGLNLSVSSTGGGSNTNAYGIKIGNVIGGNRWSIFSTDVNAAAYFAGNVGIGTSTPTYGLSIRKDGSAPPTLSLENRSAASADYGSTIAFLGTASSLPQAAITSGWNSGAGTDAYLRFFTYTAGTSTEKVRITSAGNVGIGTSTPTGKLSVRGDLRIENASGNYFGLQVPVAAVNKIYTLPSSDGTTGQMLSTDGSGILSWATPGGGAPTTNNEPLASGKIWIGDPGGKAQELVLTGDATLSNAGVLTLKPDVVTQPNVANDAISFSKLQNINSAKLIGRATAGMGDAEELSIGSGLSISGSSLVTSITGEASLDSAKIWVGDATNLAQGRVLTGDATISNVGVMSVSPRAISYSKLQDISMSGVLLGRATSGTGSTEEILVGSGLSISSGGVLTATGGVVFPLTSPYGTSSAPSYGFSTSAAGMYSSASNDLSFATNGLNRVTISNGGNVGIGTTNPTSALHTNVINDLSGGDYQLVNSLLTVNVGGGAYIGTAGNFRAIFTGSDPSTELVGLKGSTHSTSILNNAYGIRGTVSTSSYIADAVAGEFTVTGNVNNGIGLKIGTVAGTTSKYSIYASDPVAKSYFAGRVAIASSLDVTNGLVQVSNSSGSITTGLILSNSNPNPSAGNSIMFKNSSLSTGLISTVVTGTAAGSADMTFAARGSDGIQERMRITAGGKVGIGTSAPTAKLAVSGDMTVGKTSGANGTLDVFGSIVMSGSSTGFVGFRAPGVATPTIWTLPSADGTNGQVLKTDGGGFLTWASPSASGTSLNDGKIWIGSAGNLAVEQVPTGDATISNSGLITVTNQAITLPKIQNISFNRLLGRYNAGAGAPEELVIGSGLTLSGSSIVTDKTSSTASIVQGGNTLGLGMVIGTNDTNDLTFRTTSLNRMTIDAAGNVGIGTAPTTAFFDVHGGTAGSGNHGKDIILKAQNAGVGSPLNGGNIILQPGTPSSGLSGGVGIGVSVPDEIFHVRTTDNWVAGKFETNQDETAIGFKNGADSGTGYILLKSDAGAANTKYFSFKPQGIEAMAIMWNGNVGIGTSSPSNMLSLNGDSPRTIAMERVSWPMSGKTLTV
ncbi:MAG: hypothetical protein V4736_05985, partial [Bdellovibrionota bacterium]